MNPKTTSFCVGKFSYELETVYISSRWIVGFRFQTLGFVRCSPCMARNGRIFESEKYAIKYAAQKVLDFFSDEQYCIDNSIGHVKVPKKIFSNLKNIIKPDLKANISNK